MNPYIKFIQEMFFRFLFVCSLAIVNVQASEEGAVALSMIELIADGNNFRGQKIQVIGVPYVDFEASYLFSSLESYSISNTASSVYLRADKALKKEIKKYNGKYVYIAGTYSDIERKS